MDTHTLVWFDATNGKILHQVASVFDSRGPWLSPNGEMVAITANAALVIYDAKTGVERMRIPGRNGSSKQGRQRRTTAPNFSRISTSFPPLVTEKFSPFGTAPE